MADSMDGTETIYGWVYDDLLKNGRVTRKQFQEKFGQKNLGSNWHHARHAVCAILQKQGLLVSDKGPDLVLQQSLTPEENALARYTTESFRPNEEREAKEKIGGLIALFLSKPLLENKTIFLGSGTTVLHVGLQMCQRNRHYGQRFVTVNIPLAAMFCEQRTTRPVSKIRIPEAVLDTDTSRFSTMPGLSWPLTVSIVAADGCFYDEVSKKVVLYGNEDAVAANTNLFIQNTRHTVVVCLTTKKIKVGFAPNPNTGPPIRPPKNPVIRVLVTDQRYDMAVKALEADDWLIVTDDHGWDPVLKKMEKGEEPIE